MTKVGTGLPRGKPPRGGHPPELVAEARRRLGIKMPPGYVRMVSPNGARTSMAGVKRTPLDPFAIYAPPDCLGALMEHGFRIEHLEDN